MSTQNVPLSDIPAIEVCSLYKTYRTGFWRKKKCVLNNLSFKVPQGQIFGYLGPNGAGKTTTLKILLGLISQDNGTAYIFGKSHSDIQVKSRIGYLPEQPYFYDYLTGEELLNFFAQFFGLDKDERKKRIDMLFDLVRLESSRKLALRKYSKGMLQRIGIAQALINNPDLVFLDEPFSGLDPIGRREVRDIIYHLKEQHKTIFFSSHILSDVEMICNQVVIINKGNVVVEGQIDNLLETSTKGMEISFTNVPDKSLIQFKDIASGYIKQGGNILIKLPYDDKINSNISKITKLIDQNQGRLLNIVPSRESLENLFFQKVGAK